VLIREDWLDRDYIERYTLGSTRWRHGRREFDPQRVAAICGIEAATVRSVARDYWELRPAAIRLNYGMPTARGGGQCVRAIVSLPALTGHWRDPAGGALLSSSGMLRRTTTRSSTRSCWLDASRARSHEARSASAAAGAVRRSTR